MPEANLAIRTGAPKLASEPAPDPPILSALESRPSRMNEVLGVLRKAIVRGDLVPGSMHSVGSLAGSLGVSRTPVREALIELAARGMVRFERNRGVRILQTSIHDLGEIFELRLLLEVPATKRAVEKMTAEARKTLKTHLAAMEKAAVAGDQGAFWIHDRAFHLALLIQSGNMRLAAYIDSLRDMVLMRGVSTAGQSRTLNEIVAEHRQIFEHVQAGNAGAAAEAMRRHVARTGELLIEQESRGS
jgi:DNA-binding GntR family transcriptional regulator